jgi:hypothetical protein
MAGCFPPVASLLFAKRSEKIRGSLYRVKEIGRPARRWRARCARPGRLDMWRQPRPATRAGRLRWLVNYGGV